MPKVSLSCWNGVVAQLVERLVRNEKVRGSTPLGSTIQNNQGISAFHALQSLAVRSDLRSNLAVGYPGSSIFYSGIQEHLGPCLTHLIR